MITVNNIAKAYGARTLFEDVSFRLDPGKRYGIVGANGAGKSTLLRLLTGEEYLDKGDINIPGKLKLGTLNQDHFAFETTPIMDVVMQGRPELADALREKDELLVQANPSAMRIAELEEIIADCDGYVAESRISEMLEGLGIPVEKQDKNMSVLSGGYKLRVLLAQCLFSDPDVLLLDEPTNHLDILSIKWLEDYLCQFKGVVVVVSHDRRFLNQVCTHIADVDYQTVKIYTGNYDQFLQAREQDEQMRQQENEKAQKKISELQDFVTRFKAKASKARQAQSKSKQIERMEKDIVDPVFSSRIYPTVKFTSRRPPGKMVLEVENISKSYGKNRVLKDISFSVRRGDKLAILGPNGIGKSTLLKIIMNELAPDGGSFQWGHETYPEYFSQDHKEAISTTTSPYEWLYHFAPGESIGVIRGTLGNVLFSGDDVHKSTAALSGGEAARLVIAKLMLLKGNVLILDEPTNHLDMESIESLVDALESFDGTVILVSHNRYVVGRVANKILEIRDGAVDLFDGTYVEYLEKAGADHLSYQVDLRSEKKRKEKPVDYMEEKRRKKEQAAARQAYKSDADALIKESEALEAEIAGLEKKVEVINDLFSDPMYFTTASPSEVQSKNSEKKSLDTTLEGKYARWEKVNESLEVVKKKHGLE